jgi:hypothetical protein
VEYVRSCKCGELFDPGFVMVMSSGVVRLSYSTKADVRAFREVGELFDNTSKATHGGRQDLNPTTTDVRLCKHITI